MSELIPGDDGLPAEEVGQQTREKHAALGRYVNITRAVRRKWLAANAAGATYIDPFCGTGRSRIRESGKWIDGGAVAAWRESVKGQAPFSTIFVGDGDDQRRHACAKRLRFLGAPVVELTGDALRAIPELIPQLAPRGLHFAFLDPWSLGALDFRIIQHLAALERIDMLVHVSRMDLARNLDRNTATGMTAFDVFAPGWRDHVDTRQASNKIRTEVIEYWKTLVGQLGVWPSNRVRLVRGSGYQPLYWLLLAAKHQLAHALWDVAGNTDGQKSLDL